MDILYLLIPLSVVLVFFILGGLWWAIHRGQFEDIEAEGERKSVIMFSAALAMLVCGWRVVLKLR